MEVLLTRVGEFGPAPLLVIGVLLLFFGKIEPVSRADKRLAILETQIEQTRIAHTQQVEQTIAGHLQQIELLTRVYGDQVSWGRGDRDKWFAAYTELSGVLGTMAPQLERIADGYDAVAEALAPAAAPDLGRG